MMYGYTMLKAGKRECERVIIAVIILVIMRVVMVLLMIRFVLW